MAESDETDVQAVVPQGGDDELGRFPLAGAAIGGVLALVVGTGLIAVLTVAFGVVLGFLAGVGVETAINAFQRTRSSDDESSSERSKPSAPRRRSAAAPSA